MPADATEFLKGIADQQVKAMAVIVQAVNDFAEHVLGDAQQLCPVATGALRASGTTGPTEVDGPLIVKVIGFNVEYAVPVHEILSSKHPVGQAKFLETAIRTNMDKFVDFVAGRLRS